jgi:hypothetical protein
MLLNSLTGCRTVHPTPPTLPESALPMPITTATRRPGNTAAGAAAAAPGETIHGSPMHLTPQSHLSIQGMLPRLLLLLLHTT